MVVLHCTGCGQQATKESCKPFKFSTWSSEPLKVWSWKNQPYAERNQVQTAITQSTCEALNSEERSK